MSSLAERMARLIVHGEHPYNAEPPLSRLRASYRTPAGDFYVRSHGDLPEIGRCHMAPVRRRQALGPSICHWPICGRVFPRRPSRPRCSAPATAVPICGRRPGLGRSLGRWRHRDGGLDGRPPRRRPASGRGDAGADSTWPSKATTWVEGRPYGVSIPLAKALADETLLAFAMNGAPLLPEHGSRPVPSCRASRGCAAEMAAAHHGAGPSVGQPDASDDYKCSRRDVTAETADPAEGHTIETMPLNAAICEPPRGARLEAGIPPSVGTRSRETGRSCGSMSRATAGAPGARPRWNTRPVRPSPGRSGRSCWTFHRRTRTRGARWDSAGQTQRRCRTTRGTSRATSAPRGTVCESRSPEARSRSGGGVN